MDRAAARPVLVVTSVDDTTADLVIEELNSRRVPVVRLDPGDFPGQADVTASFGSAGMTGTITTQTRLAELTAVRSVYWRRPSPFRPAPGLSEQEARWCSEQARYGIVGTLAALPVAYLNHPWRNRDAEYKPLQLATATRCGLLVPPTLITSDPAQARTFAAEFGPVIYKPLWHSQYLGSDGLARTIWIDDVAPESIDSGVSRTAHLFQQRLRGKVADVRLAVVNGDPFAVRIDSPGLDWRRHYDALSYTPIETPVRYPGRSAGLSPCPRVNLWCVRLRDRCRRPVVDVRMQSQRAVGVRP